MWCVVSYVTRYCTVLHVRCTTDPDTLRHHKVHVDQSIQQYILCSGEFWSILSILLGFTQPRFQCKIAASVFSFGALRIRSNLS